MRFLKLGGQQFRFATENQQGEDRYLLVYFRKQIDLFSRYRDGKVTTMLTFVFLCRKTSE